jgi:hypothetical protein
MSTPETSTPILAAWARLPLNPQASYGLCGSLSRALLARSRQRRR